MSLIKTAGANTVNGMEILYSYDWQKLPVSSQTHWGQKALEIVIDKDTKLN